MPSVGTQVSSGSVERLDLPIAGGFAISRGREETAANVVVTLEDEAGTTGVGGVAPAAYYGQTPGETATVARDLADSLEAKNPALLQRHEGMALEAAPDVPAARTALSIALHDLVARQAAEPLYRRWGLDPDAIPRSSYTIGIDDPETMADRAREATAAGYGVLKVKLGSAADRERLALVREVVPDARIRVDVNGDWSVAEALAALEWLEGADVELLEQPVPADDVAGLRRVADATDVPVAADEACVTAGDIPHVADAVDVAVVKVAKCGGIRAAKRAILTAQAHDLAVMLGCMVSSNAAIAGACHLAPLVEYADLDGALLLAEDPFEGVPMPGGRIDLRAVEAGTGARRLTNRG